MTDENGGIELDEIRRDPKQQGQTRAAEDDDPLEIHFSMASPTMAQQQQQQQAPPSAAAAAVYNNMNNNLQACSHRNDPTFDNNNSGRSVGGTPRTAPGSGAMLTPASRCDQNNNSNQQSSSVSKKLGEIVLELRGIEKTFRVDGADEAVVALKGIHLYDTVIPSQSGGVSAGQRTPAGSPALPHQAAVTPADRERDEHEQLLGPSQPQQQQPRQQQQQQQQQGKQLSAFSSNESTSSHRSVLQAVPIQSFAAIRQGEFVMIRGPSGGGKTTLLNLIGTLDSPTRGEIVLLGNKIDKSTEDSVLADLRLRHLGFVFQTFNLIATMSAAENVELPMTLVGELNAKQRRLRARQLLSLVGLRNRIDHLPSELSGGEQQRVTIARSLANNPKILLLDEPTGDLDTATTLEVMDLLLRLNHFTKTTCIMVTHNPDVECYADRILYVSDGQFLREVVNEQPRQLVLEQYVEYLAQREKMMTTAIGRREQ